MSALGWNADIGRLLSRAMMRAFSFLIFASTLVSGCALIPTPHAQMVPPEEPLAGKLYAAIWRDLESNALIGNGNELAARWANASDEGDIAPQLHIQNLLCSGGQTLLRCQFRLLRDGGVATYLGEAAPDRLACKANFRRSGPSDDWSIPRLRPRSSGGHSRITISCQPVTRMSAFSRQQTVRLSRTAFA